MSVKKALYPGTFDCPTYGHLNVIERCARLFDELVVAVARHGGKSPLFTVDERLDLLRESVADMDNVRVDSFQGLTVHYAKSNGIHCIIRGLRAVTDFESEIQMALMNQRLAPDIETLFMAPTIGSTFISSTMAKEILAHGGDVSSLVPPHIEAALRVKLGK